MARMPLCWSTPAAPPHLAQHGVRDGAEVDGALVGQVVEDVQGPGGLGALLLVAEDQVDPLVQLARHKLTLQRLGGTGTKEGGVGGEGGC